MRVVGILAWCVGLALTTGRRLRSRKGLLSPARGHRQQSLLGLCSTGHAAAGHKTVGHLRTSDRPHGKGRCRQLGRPEPHNARPEWGPHPMRSRRFRFGVCACIALMGTSCTRAPLNPPRLVMSSNTDMAIQLFMQSTILLSNYYGYTDIKYADIVARTRKAGLDSIPFMAPETVRATPELVNLFNKYEDDPAQLAIIVQRIGGYKIWSNITSERVCEHHNRYAEAISWISMRRANTWISSKRKLVSAMRCRLPCWHWFMPTQPSRRRFWLPGPVLTGRWARTRIIAI